MPRRSRPTNHSRPAEQLPLFCESASLVRVRLETNEWRFYRLAVWPDLFGRALLVRQWGRIGTEGQRRLDAYPDPGAAMNALARLLRQRRRRGYVDRPDVIRYERAAAPRSDAPIPARPQPGAPGRSRPLHAG